MRDPDDDDENDDDSWTKHHRDDGWNAGCNHGTPSHRRCPYCMEDELNDDGDPIDDDN